MFAVVAGGVWDAAWGSSFLNQPGIEVVVAADGGADWVVMSGRLPDVLIGDLDSVTGETLALCQRKGVRVEKYPPEKNETDVELALAWAHEHAGTAEVALIGAGGGRIDHWLGNIGLLVYYAEQGRTVRLLDPWSQAWVAEAGRHDLEAFQGKTLSILPLSTEVEASGSGLKYALNHLILFQKKPRGISNIVEPKGPNWLEIHRGTALLVVLLQNDLSKE